MKPDTEKVLSILAAHENNAANLIAILQDVQAEYNYLSEANLTLIADTLDISVSRVYSVATFYENFSLEAKGKHIIKVCAGTATTNASASASRVIPSPHASITLWRDSSTSASGITSADAV